MKILSIIAQKPYATGSGVYFTELLKRFEEQGHEQAILCGISWDEDFSAYEQRFPNIRMFPLRYGSEELPFDILGMSDVMPYPSTRYRDLSAEQARRFEKAYIAKIRSAVRSFQPDLILCHHLYFLTTIVVENFSDHPITGICHGTCLRQIGSNPFERERILRAIRKLPKIFALQEEQKKEIASLGIDPERIRVVGNGYDPAIFSKKDLADEDKRSVLERIEKTFGEDFDPAEIRLAYAGKISLSKGLMSLFGAIDRIRDRRLKIYLAGGGGVQEESDMIRARARLSYHKAIFLGHRTQDELAELYRSCDLFVFPSYYEGLGLAVIEAMACGLPVVVSDTEGLRAWICAKIDDPPIEFVELPKMRDVDRPYEEELPDYERRLAEAIERQIRRIENESMPDDMDMSAFSWQKVAEEILSFVGPILGEKTKIVDTDK
ncbi:MAG: glycosyltransferase family 4 protein [Peptostreptococcaceae bacterium]|nr:glycosyltransferase family 4 protein [Peptostreptococcaceae bacterium]